MIDYKEVGDDGTWELFARDYLVEMGFVVDVPPGRGADQGRDIIVSEQLTGRLTSRKFTWLVSCKYFSVSGKSVGTADEVNILDRMRHHSADGFMGFYSTVPSSSLVDRLREYKRNDDIAAYEIFDSKKIEDRFFGVGLSKIARRYFPKSYLALRPLQKLIGPYVPLECEVCSKDVLAESLRTPYQANIIVSTPTKSPRDKTNVYVVCKGECDKIMQERLRYKGETSMWEDVGDLVNPALFLKSIMAYMNQLHRGEDVYSEEAHAGMKRAYLALAQRTLRDITEEDAKRFADSLMWEGL